MKMKTQHTIWYAAKEVLRDAKHVKKQERFQINYLSLLPKRLEKEKQIKTKISRIKEIKTKADSIKYFKKARKNEIKKSVLWEDQ